MPVLAPVCVVINWDDDSRFIRAAVRDITERHLISEALRKAHNGLEQRVEERTTELREANVELAREIEEHRQSAESLRKALSETKTLKAQLEAENIYFRTGNETETPIQSDSRAKLHPQACTFSDGARMLLRTRRSSSLARPVRDQELVAAAIHSMSPRKNRALITVKSAALQANMIESELSGRKKRPLPVPIPGRQGGLRLPMGPPCAWMRLENCPWSFRPSCSW